MVVGEERGVNGRGLDLGSYTAYLLMLFYSMSFILIELK